MPINDGQRRRTIGQRQRSTVATGDQWWRSTMVASGGPPLTNTEPSLTTTRPSIKGGKGGIEMNSSSNSVTEVKGLDHNHWENPHEFRPERFENNNLEVRGQHFHLLTFGSGRRMCPGISLAQHIVHTTLGAMIQCFEWKAGKDGNLSRVEMDEGTGLTLPRANRLVCVPVARFDQIPFSMQHLI
nr:cytochrome P450 93A3-like [Tanacetum cinerariifolium]